MKITEAPMDVLTATAIKIRDEIAKEEAKQKEAIRPLKTKLEKLEAEALRRLLADGAKHVSTPSGTAILGTKTSVTVADWDSFFHQYVLPHQAWDLIERRACKTLVLQMKEETGDIPPGLNYSEMYDVSFRRS